MLTDKKTEELNEADLDQVTGGTGKTLIGHELTHVQQQGGGKYIGETEKNLGLAAGRATAGDKGFTKTGGGNSI